MFENEFVNSYRLVPSSNGNGWTLEIGSVDAPFLGVHFNRYFNNRISAENTANLIRELLRVIDAAFDDALEILNDDVAAENVTWALYEAIKGGRTALKFPA